MRFFNVYVSQEFCGINPTNYDTSKSVLCYQYNDVQAIVPESLNRTCLNPILGNYVTLYKSDEKDIHLSEIEIYVKEWKGKKF